MPRTTPPTINQQLNLEAKAPATTAIVTTPIETETATLSAGLKIVVSDRDTYLKASQTKDAAKAVLKQISDTFDGHIAAAYRSHKELCATKKKFADPVDQVIRHVSRQMSDFEIAQERSRRQEEARLAEQSRKHQEDLAVAQAANLEAAGHTEAAEQVIQEAIAAPEPAVMLEKFNPNDYGRSSRSVWRWEIVDISKLNLTLLTVSKNSSTGLNQEISTTGLGALIRTMHDRAHQTVGEGACKIWEDKTTV